MLRGDTGRPGCGGRGGGGGVPHEILSTYREPLLEVQGQLQDGGALQNCGTCRLGMQAANCGGRPWGPLEVA